MKSKVLLLLVAANLWACGSIKTKEKDVTTIAQIKKVAVVSFTQDQPAPNEISFSLNSKSLEGSAGGSMITQNSEYTDKNYKNLVEQLKRAGFEVMPVAEMLKNPHYKATYKSTMEGWQNKMPPGQGMNRFGIENVMDFDSARILGVAGRDELAKNLKVDAIVVARVNVYIEASTVMGIGNRYPQSNVFLTMYKPGMENAVWFETFKGATSTESVGKTGLFDEVKLSQLAVKSTEDALSKISKSAE